MVLVVLILHEEGAFNVIYPRAKVTLPSHLKRQIYLPRRNYAMHNRTL